MELILEFLRQNMVPLVWLAVTILLVVFEAVTVDLVSIWFALGALCACIAASFGVTLLWQIVIFIIVSVAALISTRKFVKGVLRVKKTPTNADSVIGQQGVVTEAVDNVTQDGRARIAGMDWTARSADGKFIPAGAVVKVVRLEGVKAIIEPVSE